MADDEEQQGRREKIHWRQALDDGLDHAADRLEGKIEDALGVSDDNKADNDDNDVEDQGEEGEQDDPGGSEEDAGQDSKEDADPEVSGGGYTPSSAASYAADIAMMRAEVDYTTNTVVPHYELLIAQATTAGNGPKTLQSLRAGLEAARAALGAAQEAISTVQATSEPVQAAYDDAGGEAARDKAYFHGD